MDYRLLAIDELKKLNHNYTAEKVIKLRIIDLDTRLKSSGGGIGGATPNIGGGNKTEHKWLSLISSISDEKKRLKDVNRAIRRVELALSAVSEEEARILREAYIENRNMDEIAGKEHVSRATAYRLRDSALINFTRAFYGAVVN